MNIPKSIKVGGVNYKVEMVDHIPNEDTGIQIGECDFHQASIKVLNSLCVEKQEQTFIHELTHAIAQEAGIDDQDEDLINRFALVAYQVIKDLPSAKIYADGAEINLEINGNKFSSFVDDTSEAMLNVNDTKLEF